jgi:hypothetical protein
MEQQHASTTWAYGTSRNSYMWPASGSLAEANVRQYMPARRSRKTAPLRCDYAVIVPRWKEKGGRAWVA